MTSAQTPAQTATAALDALEQNVVVAVKALMVAFGFPSAGTVSDLDAAQANALKALADAINGVEPDRSLPTYDAAPPAGSPPPSPYSPYNSRRI